MDKLDKKLYKGIKKYNRDQMKTFLSNLYIDAYREGQRDSNNTDVYVEVGEIIKTTKGVGDVLYERIMNNIKEGLNV